MSKSQKSKLDPFAERLDEWLGLEKRTLADVQAALAQDGCSVSLSRLSVWWEARQQELAEQRLLSEIVNGAERVKKVRTEFSENAPPDLQMLIDLHRVLILQMSTQAASNPDLIKLADQGLRTVMEFVTAQTRAKHKDRELALAEGKWAWIQKEDLDRALDALHAEIKNNAPALTAFQNFKATIRGAQQKP